jgi:hypothetical protein
MPKLPLFKCPHCPARYHVVEIEVDPSVDVAISCLICDRPLFSRDGKYAFKYFLPGGQGTARRARNTAAQPEAKRDHVYWRKVGDDNDQRVSNRAKPLILLARPTGYVERTRKARQI